MRMLEVGDLVVFKSSFYSKPDRARIVVRTERKELFRDHDIHFHDGLIASYENLKRELEVGKAKIQRREKND